MALKYEDPASAEEAPQDPDAPKPQPTYYQEEDEEDLEALARYYNEVDEADMFPGGEE